MKVFIREKTTQKRSRQHLMRRNSQATKKEVKQEVKTNLLNKVTPCLELLTQSIVAKHKYPQKHN